MNNMIPEIYYKLNVLLNISVSNISIEVRSDGVAQISDESQLHMCQCWETKCPCFPFDPIWGRKNSSSHIATCVLYAYTPLKEIAP